MRQTLMLVCLLWATLFLEAQSKPDANAPDWVRGLNAQDLSTLADRANAGSAKDQFSMGYLSENGYLVPMDAASAVKWYEKAAAQDDARSENNLGMMYLNGKGVGKDPAAAMRWFHRAFDHGHLVAPFNIAAMYSNG